MEERHTKEMLLYARGDPNKLGEGGKTLLSLMQTDNYYSLGFDLPTIRCDGKNLHIKQLLGSGCFGVVYEIGENSATVVKDEAVSANIKTGDVVKVFRNVKDRKAGLTCVQESRILETLKGLYPESAPFVFPTIIAFSDDGQSLVMRPKGIAFANTVEQYHTGFWNFLEPNQSNITQKSGTVIISPHLLGALIDALKFLHTKAKILHRDIKLDNILAVRQVVRPKTPPYTPSPPPQLTT